MEEKEEGFWAVSLGWGWGPGSEEEEDRQAVAAGGYKYGTLVERKEFLGAFIREIRLDPSDSDQIKGEIHFHDMVAASFWLTGWTSNGLEKTSRRGWSVTFWGQAEGWRAAA